MKTVEELNELTEDEIHDLPELTDMDDDTGLTIMGPSLHADYQGRKIIISVAQNAEGEVFKITSILSTNLKDFIL